MRQRILSDDEAEAMYQEYCKFLQARFMWHPKKLCAKYRVSRDTLRRYIKERRRLRAA